MQKVNINNLPEGFTYEVNEKGLNILTFPGGRVILSKSGRFMLAAYGKKAGLMFPYYQQSFSEPRLGCAFEVEDNEVWVPTPEEVVFSDDPRYIPLLKGHGVTNEFAVGPADQSANP
jgi:hypothetical protein